MKILNDDEVVDRATRWARLHASIKTREKMDAVLDGLSKADQRRVYLCGQRIACGLSVKVIPAPVSATPTPAVKPIDFAKQKSKSKGKKKK